MSIRRDWLDGSPSEGQVQRAVMAHLAYAKRMGRVVWYARMNSGAGRMVGADGLPGRWLRFGFRGCPDILGQMPDGRLLAVEVKRGNVRRAVVRPEQAAFLELAAAHGAVAGIVHSHEDLELLVPIEAVER